MKLQKFMREKLRGTILEELTKHYSEKVKI